MEYMIQENTLIEIADALRNKLEYKDLVTNLIGDRNKIISATIPNSVTTIGSFAFYSCRNLTNITIPNSITDISFLAFKGCTSLTDMYLYPNTPPTLDSTNAISTATIAIHVPVGSGDAYKSATNWSQYADIIIEDIVIE